MPTTFFDDNALLFFVNIMNLLGGHIFKGKDASNVFDVSCAV